MKLKKGFIFSLFVITALALIVMTYKLKTDFREEKKAEIYKSKVEQINVFLADMEKDLDRALYVTAFRAFLGADEYIHRHESYIDNIDARLPELILYGTIKGEQMNTTNASTFNDWAKRMQDLSKRFNVNITFENTDITIEENGPWTIEIRMNTTVSVIDFDEVIGWNYDLVRKITIDISEANFPDPVYYLESLDNIGNSSNPLLNRIRKNPFDKMWINESLIAYPENINVTNLINITMNQFYMNNTRAPSYLMRMEGDFGNSNYGIESFVNVINDSNIWEYSEEGEATCAADYQFFVKGCSGEKHKIINMPDRFYLDEEHLRDYGMQNINST